MGEFLHQFGQVKHFTQLELTSTYHQIYIKKANK